MVTNPLGRALIRLLAVTIVKLRGSHTPMPSPDRSRRTPTQPASPLATARKQPEGAGMSDYLKEAFLFRWNLLFLLGGAAAAALTPAAAVLLPLVGAAEIAYLTGLVSVPRFRAAIDAKVHASQTDKPSQPVAPSVSLVEMLSGLPRDARLRFERLHARCVELRGIAAGVRGAAGDRDAAAEEIRTPGLDRLLWWFLRLLLSRTALDRFLQTMSEQEIKGQLEELRKNLAAAQGGGDERIARALQDSVASAELRLDNYGRAKKNADFVSVELNRLEGKIQALAEMAVNRQDPDFLSTQVDSAAESMRQTEKAVSELQHLTGLADQLQETPAILETDLRQVLQHDA